MDVLQNCHRLVGFLLGRPPRALEELAATHAVVPKRVVYFDPTTGNIFCQIVGFLDVFAFMLEFRVGWYTLTRPQVAPFE